MRRRVPALLALLAWSLLQASPASAQLKGNPDNVCRNGYFPRESTNYRLAKIKGAAGDRVYFRGDDGERCPDDQACRLKTYVIPGDEIIVSRTLGKFACSWFQPRKGTETVGWIETERLAWQEGTRPPAMPDWLGEWRAYENRIRISKSKEVGALAIKGEASWGSGASTHTGELDYDAKPSADKMKFGDGRTNTTARSRCSSSANYWSSATTSIAAAPTCLSQESTNGDRSDEVARRTFGWGCFRDFGTGPCGAVSRRGQQHEKARVGCAGAKP